MGMIQWNQHKQLIVMVNDLSTAMKNGSGQEAIGSILNRLTSYTVQHFADEERFFVNTDYPGSDLHIQKHKQLVEKVSAFKKDFDAGKAFMTTGLLKFLNDWLQEHIMKTDRTYAKYL